MSFSVLLMVELFKDLDFLIIESGIGGLNDSTDVFLNDLLLVTNIGLDHQEILGTQLSNIASNKLGAMKSHCILGYQENKSVIKIAKQIAATKGFKLEILQEYKINFTDFNVQNRFLAKFAAKALGFQADLSSFTNGLKARAFSKDNVIYDVGHNHQAAKAICKVLANKKFILVYNCLTGKDYESILYCFKHIVSSVHVIDIDDKRAVEKQNLFDTAKKIGIACKDFNGIKPYENYLVFGSHQCVVAFIRQTGFSI